MKKYLNYLILLSSCLYCMSAMAETYALVSAYGEKPNKAIRWPNGTVYIYDYTKFVELSKVVNIFNKNMSNTKLALTDETDNADITIEMAESFNSPYEEACGLTSNTLDATQTFYTKSSILLKPSTCLDRVTVINLYLHELGHALGFTRHTDTNDVMSKSIKDNGNYENIDVLTKFITGLYSLEPGQTIDKNMALPTITGSSIVEKPTNTNMSIAELAKLQQDKKEKKIQTKKPAEIITLRPLPTVGRRIDVITPTGISSTWATD